MGEIIGNLTDWKWVASVAVVCVAVHAVWHYAH